MEVEKNHSRWHGHTDLNWSDFIMLLHVVTEKKNIKITDGYSRRPHTASANKRRLQSSSPVNGLMD